MRDCLINMAADNVFKTTEEFAVRLLNYDGPKLTTAVFVRLYLSKCKLAFSGK
jgi:hypothetical protein